MCALEFFATFENRPGTEDAVHPLEVGRAVSVKSSASEPLAAIVAEISPTGIRLRLIRSVSILPSRDGDQVLIKYWTRAPVPITGRLT